jgi:transcriptional regulator with XRE-family HTH domain
MQLMKFNSHALRAWRTAKGMTGAQLAEAAGLKSQGHIASLEAGDKQPSWATVERLAEALSISPQCLVAPTSLANAESWPYSSGRRNDRRSVAA